MLSPARKLLRSDSSEAVVAHALGNSWLSLCLASARTTISPVHPSIGRLCVLGRLKYFNYRPYSLAVVAVLSSFMSLTNASGQETKPVDKIAIANAVAQPSVDAFTPQRSSALTSDEFTGVATLNLALEVPEGRRFRR